MKKSDIFKLHKTLETVKNFGSAKFKYNIIKNLKTIKTDYDTLVAIAKETDDVLLPFYNERNELIRKHGTENAEGNFQIKNEDVETLKKFKSELKPILDKHEVIFTQHAEKNKEFDVLLAEEVEKFDWFTVSVDGVCDEISGEDLELLMDFGIVE